MAAPLLPLLMRFLPTLLGEGSLARGGISTLLGRAAPAGQAMSKTSQVTAKAVDQAVKAKPAGEMTFRQKVLQKFFPKAQPQETPQQNPSVAKLFDRMFRQEQKRTAPSREERRSEPDRPRRNTASAADVGFATADTDSVVGQARQHFQEQRQKKLQEADESQNTMVGKTIKVAASLGKMALKLALIDGLFYSTSRALEGFAASTAEGQRELGRFNFGIAAAFTRLDINRQRREIQRGGATEGSTRDLVDTLDRLEQEFAPIKNDLTTIVNFTASMGASIARMSLAIGKYLPMLNLIRLAAEAIESNTKEKFEAGDKMHTFLGMLRNQPGAGPPPPLPAPRAPRDPLPPIKPMMPMMPGAPARPRRKR